MYYMVLDTETASTWRGKCVAKAARVYDVGYMVVDSRTGESVCERSFAIRDTFANDKLMHSCYYADKLPQYYAGMRDGTWECVSLHDAWETWQEDARRWHVRETWAWNVAFDRTALDATITAYSHGYVTSWWDAVPRMETLDVMSAAARTVLATERYRAWGRATGILTPSGNPSTTAEAAYRYMTGNTTFSECHTALEDARIEGWMLHRLRRSKHGVRKWGRRPGLKAPRG